MSVFRNAALAAILLVTMHSPSAALSFGVGPKVGMNFGGAAVDDIEDEERRTGLALGAMAEFGVTSPFSLVLEPGYVQRGARFEIVGARVRGDLDYFEIPVLAKAKFGSIRTGHGYVFAGPSFGFLTSSEGRVAGFTGEFEDQVASFVLSGDLGGGGAYRVSRYVFLSADLRYTHGFGDALEDPIGGIDSWHHRDIRASLGVLFHLTE